MYLRIVWGKLRPGAWEEFEQHYCDRVVPMDTQIRGLRERQLLRCAEDPDEGISVSLWDTLEDLRNYERSEAYKACSQEVKHLYLGQYWVKTLEFGSLDTRQSR